MTKRQRRLIWKCAVVVGFIAFFLVFLERPWLQWVLMALFAVALIFEKPPHRPPDIEVWVHSYPLVKLWLAICGLVIAGIAIASVTSLMRFDEVLGFRGLLGLFVAAITPLIGVGVWETYKKYGEEGDAI